MVGVMLMGWMDATEYNRLFPVTMYSFAKVGLFGEKWRKYSAENGDKGTETNTRRRT